MRSRARPGVRRSRSPSATAPGARSSPTAATVDFTPLAGSLEDDLASRDFTINALARQVGSTDLIDPFDGAVDLRERTIRAVSADVFRADPLRLLRAVRLEDELGFLCDGSTETLVRSSARLVTQPAGERIVAELERLSIDGWRRLDELGLLEELGGSLERADRAALVDSPDYRLVCFLGDGARAVAGLEVAVALRANGAHRGAAG